MSGVRQFVKDSVKRVKGFSKKKKNKPRSYVDVTEGAICNADSTDDLLKCLVKNMKEFDGEMMVCVSESDLGKSDASLRAMARKNGIELKVKKKVMIEGINDAICLRISKEDRKRLLQELA